MKTNTSIVSLEIIPLENGLHIAVKCKVGRYNALMLIDTGASQSVFDMGHKAFEKLNLTRISEPVKSSGINSEIHDLFTGNIDSFRIGEIRIRNMQALFMPFNHINSMYKALKLEPLAGILGGDFLEFYEAEISYRNSEIHLKLNKD
ncbi:MAG TPA: retropepsin-like aspartic protease [Bacteroidales bacterium]|nr:retropepsin-like aspartic protease [Bacteroidales bacterium]